MIESSMNILDESLFTRFVKMIASLFWTGPSSESSDSENSSDADMSNGAANEPQAGSSSEYLEKSNASATIEILDVDLVEVEPLCVPKTRAETLKSKPSNTWKWMRRFGFGEDTGDMESASDPDASQVIAVIDEANFYMEQELFTDARIALDDLTKLNPNHSKLKEQRFHLIKLAKEKTPDGVIPEDAPTKIVDYNELIGRNVSKK